MSEETVIFNLELNVAEAMSEARKLELAFSRIAGLLRRLGLPEEADRLVQRIQQIVNNVRLLHSAIIALNTALIAVSGGSFGLVQFALAGTAIAGAGISFSDMLSGY